MLHSGRTPKTYESSQFFIKHASVDVTEASWRLREMPEVDAAAGTKQIARDAAAVNAAAVRRDEHFADNNLSYAQPAFSILEPPGTCPQRPPKSAMSAVRATRCSPHLPWKSSRGSRYSKPVRRRWGRREGKWRWWALGQSRKLWVTSDRIKAKFAIHDALCGYGRSDLFAHSRRMSALHISLLPTAIGDGTFFAPPCEMDRLLLGRRFRSAKTIYYVCSRNGNQSQSGNLWLIWSVAAGRRSGLEAATATGVAPRPDMSTKRWRVAMRVKFELRERRHDLPHLFRAVDDRLGSRLYGPVERARSICGGRDVAGESRA